MFGFFKKKQKSLNSHSFSHVAPGTQIHYFDNLITDLQKDHRVLLATFENIQLAFKEEKYNKVTEHLKQFRRKITDHLLAENVQLYIYLTHEFSQDEITSELVKEFRREMNDISKVVMAFLSKYETIGVDKCLAKSFARDLAAIGSALVERIEREEHTLYPLYMPSY